MTWLIMMIQKLWKYHALCYCVFKNDCMFKGESCFNYRHEHGWDCFFPYRNYSVEGFYNDVSEYFWVQIFRKHAKSFISPWIFLRILPCFERLFPQNVRCIPAPGVTLTYCKHDLDLCFINSYSIIHPVSGKHMFGYGLLSMSFPISQGIPLWQVVIFADLIYPEMKR